MLYYLFYFSFVFVLLLVGIFSIEAWPFSAYSMFSYTSKKSTPSVLYLEIQFTSGEKFRWRPQRDLFRKRIDQDLKLGFLSEEKKPNEWIKLKKVVSHYYQFYCIEQNSIKEIDSFNIIQEQWGGETQVLKSFKVVELDLKSES